VEAWIHAQGEYTRSVLDSNPGRAALAAEVRKLDQSQPARLGEVMMLPGDELFT